MNDRKKVRNVPTGDSPTAFTRFVAAIAREYWLDFYPDLAVQIVLMEVEGGSGLLIMEVGDRFLCIRNERGVTISRKPPEGRDALEKGETIVDHGKNPADSL